MSWYSLADFKTYRGVSGVGDDSLISSLIASAESWLDRECRQYLVAVADTTEYIDAEGDHISGRTLHLSDFGPCCAITSITNGDGTTVTSAQYTTYPKAIDDRRPFFDRVVLLTSQGVSWTYDDDMENAIEIVGRWGLYSNSPPADVTHLVRRLVGYAYAQKDAQIFDTIAIPDAGIIQVPAGFPIDATRIVRAHRRYT